MRKRNVEFHFMLTENEAIEMKAKAAKCGLSVQSYLRCLIRNTPIKEQPSVDFFAVLKALEKIGDNINQIAAKANSTGRIDKAEYLDEADHLERVISDLMRAAFS